MDGHLIIDGIESISIADFLPDVVPRGTIARFRLGVEGALHLPTRRALAPPRPISTDSTSPGFSRVAPSHAEWTTRPRTAFARPPHRRLRRCRALRRGPAQPARREGTAAWHAGSPTHLHARPDHDRRARPGDRLPANGTATARRGHRDCSTGHVNHAIRRRDRGNPRPMAGTIWARRSMPAVRAAELVCMIVLPD